MKILWVEDNPENKQKFWFEERRVTLVTDFSQAKLKIENDLNNYDVIVIDIDLENSDKESAFPIAKDFGLSVDDFLKKSGMVLFLSLLEQGFPRKNIIFLTGNVNAPSLLSKALKVYINSNESNKDKALDRIRATLGDDEWRNVNEKCKNKTDLINCIEKKICEDSDVSENTFETFSRIFKDACIYPPEEVISKFNDYDAKEELHEWLKGHENNDYLSLRRGIIEGCNHLKTLKENDLHFNHYISESEKKISFRDAQNYVAILKNFLPLVEPKNKEILYKLFVRTLAHEWDVCSINRRKDWETELYSTSTFVQIMMMVRNWVSHDKLLEPINEKIISFLFIVNMRAMFNLGSNTQDYEKELLKCISAPPFSSVLSYQDDINNAEYDVDKLLDITNNVSLKDNSYKYCIRKKEVTIDFFNQKINTLYLEQQKIKLQYGYEQLLLQCFFVSHLKFVSDPKNESDWLENISNSDSNSGDFLLTLARYIYSRSFS